MANRHKPVNMTPEEKQAIEDEKYFQGKPTRAEVMSYVNGLLEEKYMPRIMSSFQLGMMTMEAILIKKGVCTGEEIQEITEHFLMQHNKESEHSNPASEENKE